MVEQLFWNGVPVHKKCNHDMCKEAQDKDITTCLYYGLAKGKQQDVEDFEESFPELDIEDYVF